MKVVLALVALMVMMMMMTVVVVSRAVTIGPMYPQRVVTRTLLYNTAWSEAYCLEDGAPGAAQGVGSQQYEAVQPCRYGQVRLGTGGDYLQFGCIGGVGSALADLGMYSALGTTLNATQALPYATNFLGLSVCGTELCAVSNRSGTGNTLLRHIVHIPELLTTSTQSQFIPKVGHVYVVRLTNDGAVTTANVVDRTTLLAKFTVNQAAAGEYHISWTIFFGEVTEPASSGDQQSSSDHKRHGNDSKITVAEALSITSLALSAIAICAMVFSCVMIRRSVTASSSYTPINH